MLLRTVHSVGNLNNSTFIFSEYTSSAFDKFWASARRAQRRKSRTSSLVYFPIVCWAFLSSSGPARAEHNVDT